MAIYGVPKYLFHYRRLYMCIRLSSTEKQRANKEPIFHQREAQLNADIKGNQFSFKYQTTTKLNYDLWQWLFDLLETISKRKNVRQAKEHVFKLMNELQEVRNTRDGIKFELEELQKSLQQYFTEKKTVLSQGYASSEFLRLSVKENDCKIREKQLCALLIKANTKEQATFSDFLAAVKLSLEMEILHSRFLKAMIVMGLISGVFLTTLGFYAYNFYLLNETLLWSRNKSQSQESWGSYLKGYIRPLYSWAFPKK